MGGAFLMYPQCPFLVFCRFLKKAAESNRPFILFEKYEMSAKFCIGYFQTPCSVHKLML